MNVTSAFLAAVWLVAVLAVRSGAYRPVVLVHGLELGHQNGMENLHKVIQEENSGTYVYLVRAFADELSLTTPLWEQVHQTYQEVKKILHSAPDGVVFICYSQGGLICRGIIQAYPDHNVHTFISISSPQMGQYGVTNYGALHFIPESFRKILGRLFYSKLGQETLSLANFWNDPYHQDLYHKYCVFLPGLNNASSPEYKTNFLKIKQLVLIGGCDDGVITPWESSIFGFYADKDDTVIVEMKDQKEVYQEDSFGLQTLDRAGNVTMCVMPSVKHTHWTRNERVFHKCIKPWLD